MLPNKTFTAWILCGTLLSPWISAAAGEVCYGTQSGKVYHNDPDCPSGRKIQEENRIKFESKSDAEAQGRRLCRMCERLAAKKSRPKPQEDKPAQPPPAQPPPPPAKKQPTTKPAIDPAKLVKIKEFLPGGTMLLDNHEKARLLGVSMPQRAQPQSQAALAWLETRHRGKKIIISWDESSRPPQRDCHGRLRYYMQSNPDGPDWGADLLSQGLAWVDREQSFARRAEYLELEYQAWVANRGIWKRLDGSAGLEKVQTGRHAQQFHPPGCGHIAHLIEPVTITINEAKARRLSPCEDYRTRGIGRSAAEQTEP